MEKVYSYNHSSCSYEEIKKPFLMHNIILLLLMITSLSLFLIICFNYSKDEKTEKLAPGITKKGIHLTSTESQ